jgi:RHS repeat-associated protein
MVYDANGNLTQATGSRSNTISYSYDALNRKTGQYDAPLAAQSTANQLASWVYDNSNNAVAGMKYPIGQLTTETAYPTAGGAAYTTQQSNFNVFGESTGQKVTIPSSTEGSVLGLTYTFLHLYSTNTGLLLKDVYPAAGGLPSETVNHGYHAGLDLPDTIGGLNGYADGTSYDAFGRVNQETLGAQPNVASLTSTWDVHTGRLTDQLLNRAVATPHTVDDESYTYDLAGDITKQASTRLEAAAPTETQCYTYDQIDRLTAAWTATDSCAATPTTSNHTTVGDNLGLASTYWSTWAFDALGDRTTQTQHATVTGGSDTTTGYTYNGNATSQPHALTATNTTGGSTGTTSYGYDTTGNMTNRVAAQGTQSLHWDDAGRLTAITGGTAGNSSFEYDADGNLLLQKDPGTTTLYLPGEQIVLNTSTNTASGTRYYSLPGGGTAVRTGTAATAFTFEITDQHGTPALYLDYTAQTPTWRQYTPYGDTRGAATAVPDNRGFLNKPLNTATGLTEVGARNYDPTTGRFVSLDPILELADPQQLNGYAYAAANPATDSDPTGLCRYSDDDLCIGGGSNEVGKTITNGSGHSVTMSDAHCCSGPTNTVVAGGRLKHGTTWSVGSNGQPSINGYALPSGGPDLGWLAQKVDDECGDNPNPWCGQRGATENWTASAIGAACGTNSCSSDFRDALVYQLTWGSPAWVAAMTSEGGRPGKFSGKSFIRTACGNSFDGRTQVAMADHSTELIKDIKIDDEVIATDPTTGKTTPRRVTALHLNEDTDLVDLAVITGTGSAAILHTTQHHAFWDDTRHAWVDAVNLQPGDRLHALNGQIETVTAVRLLTLLHPMYNLTVDTDHTYYVITGTTPVLVHNCGTDNNYTWPKNNGFEGPSVNVTLPEGYLFDRYGGVPEADTGRFASPAGTPFEMRSLPRSSQSRIFTTYRVVKPFGAQTGVVRPWGGQPGGGFQLNFNDSIANLVKQGYIEPVG